MLNGGARYTPRVARHSASRRPSRGIAPELLLSQVRNTAPYIFGEADDAPAVVAAPPAVIVREVAQNLSATLTHFEYFRLCLAAHYVTCATPVPTDVDNQIRQTLWPEGLPLVTALEMAQLVLTSRDWDFTPLTSRTSFGAAGTELEHAPLNGHLGEWFTVATASYAALGRYRAADAKKLRAALLEAIAAETERHSEIFGSLWRAKDGLGALLASVSIAHNFGDLDRVVDAWDVNVADPLRLHFYKLGTSAFDPEGRLRHKGRLWTAGELYKASIEGSSMALENHRHFALRKPRSLRALPELRVPLAPFFDAWGARVAGTLQDEDLVETIDALVHGSERMPSAVAYPRALGAIREARPDLGARVEALAKTSPRLRTLLTTPREELEARWSAAALAHLDEIPGRA